MTTLGYLRSVREWAYPERKTSAFLEKGVLTPEEFVLAGDELVYRCPTWSWESGDPKKIKNYLPADKQYLVTRNVPCQSRVSSMENYIATEGEASGENALDDDELGDWLVSSVIKQQDGDDTKLKKGGEEYDNIDDEFDILDEDGEVVMKKETPSSSDAPAAAAAPVAAGGGGADDDDDEYADMADFEDDNIVVDDAAAVVNPSSSQQQSSSNDNNANVVKVRTYDLSITYDKYYQTPRVWMVGKSEYGQPLTGKEMMEDVISDYANKTVTIENHPHVSGPHASIHPCQHGKVMKAIVRNLIKDKDASEGDGSGGDADGGDGTTAATNKGPSVEMYIFIFLKFVSSIIPTINYDFTMDVTANTSK